jgi:DnaA family protein
MTGQLPLALRWPPQQRFETFLVGGNGVVVDRLRAAAGGDDDAWLHVAGAAGSGRTHLLIAACAAANTAGRSAQYLSPGSLASARAAAIRGFGGSDLLAIDDLDSIAGDDAAEHALFDLYNRCRAERSTLIFAARSAPTQSTLRLADLVSRLSACTQLALKPLDEAQRREVLRERAAQRGIDLDEAVLDWLFAREKRDLRSLVDTLDRIDVAALAAQRRVTVPFLRGLLASET